MRSIVLITLIGFLMAACAFGPEMIPFKAKVTYDGATLEYNDKVGNEWSIHASVDGMPIASGETMVIDSSGRMVLHASAIEEDPTYNDSGSAILDIYRADLTSEWQSFSLGVIVREVGGNYEGNTARWAFLFSICLEVIDTNN